MVVDATAVVLPDVVDGTISQLTRPCQCSTPWIPTVMGVFDNVSQVSLQASTVPASSSAVREVCEHSSWVEDEEFLNGFEEV